MILFDQVSKVFPNGYVGLDEVSFEINPGTLTYITGESGAGKTTLMRLMIREMMPTEGEIFIDGESLLRLPLSKVPYLRRKVSVVFQDFKLIPERTVAENIDLVLEIAGMSSRQRPQRIEEVLSLVELQDRLDLFPVQLSGGELQRVAFARALSTTPSVIFADEPTGNLDPQTGSDIGDLIEKIVSLGTTVLVATHDQNLLAQHPDARILTLKQGRLAKDSAAKPVTEESIDSSEEKKSSSKKKNKKAADGESSSEFLEQSDSDHSDGKEEKESE